MGDSVFMISSSRVCLRVSFCVLLLPSHSWCYRSLSLVPLPNALPDPPRTWASCRAGKAWWVNCLMAVATSYRDSPLSSVRVFSFSQYPMISCWSADGSSSIAPLGTSCRIFAAHSCVTSACGTPL